MRSEHLDGRVVLHGGDSRDVLKGLADASIDSVVTDPPYALVSIVKRFGADGAAPTKDGDVYSRSSSGFMGKQWDTGETAFATTFWAEIMRVLKPGGHVVAFSGTRTYHRLAVAIEDAGFEIRDQLAWAYGSGFPKSHDVSKGIDKALGAERAKVRRDATARIGSVNTVGGDIKGDSRPWIEAAKERGYHELDGPEAATPQAARWQGWGTALKPAWEPIVLARKPLAGTVAANVLAYQTGALNIDATRIGDSGGTATITGQDRNTTVHAYGDGLGAQGGSIAQLDKGRWPANIVHDGSDEVVAAFPETHSAGAARVEPGGGTYTGDTGIGFAKGGSGMGVGLKGFRIGDAGGSAARFFASFPQEEHECTHSNANAAESISLLSKEHVDSALSHAVAQSTERLALTSIAYPEPSTIVTPNELRLISATVIELMQSLERRFSLGLPPENITTTISHVRAAATQKQTGTTTITISLSKSNGFAELVTFNITPQSLELGAKDLVSAPHRLFYSGKADKQDRIGSKHPTVKPVDLMQWLCRLVTPPGGTVLDPFAGSGSTGEAAWREGFQCVLIEREPEYQADIAERLRLADKGPLERRRRAIKQTDDIGPLFGSNDNAPPQRGEGRKIYGHFADQDERLGRSASSIRSN